jgi:hypothetical protein
MSSKFLNGSGNVTFNDLTDGSISINAAQIQLSNLIPNLPIKADASQKLYSTYLTAADITGVLVNPYIGTIEATDFESKNYFSINDELQKIDNLGASTANNTNVNGRLHVSGEISVPKITDPTELTRIELDDTDIYIIGQNLTFNGSNILSATGTNQQYIMGDGSTLQYSANSGNSNFYLYNNGTDQNPTPANGVITYNAPIQDDATIIYISHRTRDTVDIEVFFKNLSTLNDVYIQDQENSANSILYNITGIPIIVDQAQISIPVVKTASAGSGSSNFGNGHNLLLSFFTNSIETDSRVSALETKTRNITSNQSVLTTIEKSTQFRLTSLDRVSITLDVGLDTFPKFIISGTQVSSLIPMSMSNQKLNGIITPVDNDDAVNKLYVDNASASKLDVAGGTMFGALSMFNNKITTLAAPTDPADAVNKSYVDNAISGGAGLSPYFRQANQVAAVTTSGLTETVMTTTANFGSYSWADTAVGQTRKWVIRGVQNRGTFSGVYTIRFKSGAGGTTNNVDWILPSQGPSAVSNQPFILEITTVRTLSNSLSYYASFTSVGASTVGFFLFTSQNQTGGILPLGQTARYNITVQSSIASCSLQFTYIDVMAILN